MEEIKEHYSPNSKQRRAILNKLEDLKQQPWSGRTLPDLDDKYIRQSNAKKYRIIYHIAAEYLLVILRVLSFKRSFKPDDNLDFDT